MEKVKVSPDVAKALDDMFHDKDLDKEKIFFHHRINLQGNGWVSELYKPLNNVSLDAMYDILEQGYEVDTDRPTPKTPRQMGSEIVRLTQPNARCQVKPIPERSTAEELQAELDYELVSLHHALSNDDVAEVERSKQRLSEIHEELYPTILEGF